MESQSGKTEMPSRAMNYGTIETPYAVSTSRVAGCSRGAAPGEENLSEDARGQFSRLRERASWKATIASRTKSKVSLSARLMREATETPLQVFKELIDVLHEGHIPGPHLLRLRAEFEMLGQGRTFQVLGASAEFQQRADEMTSALDASPELLQRADETMSIFVNEREGKWKLQACLEKVISDVFTGSQRLHVRACLRRLKAVAVKRAVVSDQASQTSGSSLRRSREDATRAFGKQLAYIRDEVNALCRAPFRHHRNIVKLLGWGLCLDELEDEAADEPRVPLLLLERAEASLDGFLQTANVSYEKLRRICLDIGRGLQAIHWAGFCHGDLKTSNILVFRDGNDSFLAKICDFGLSQSPEVEEAPYQGSYGWTPLRGSQRLAPGNVQRCDIFAYGLVIWSIFTRTCGSPLPPHLWEADEGQLFDTDRKFSEHQIYYTASQAVRAAGVAPADEINRIVIVLRDALHGDQRLWRRQPWVYFNADKYQTIPRVDDDATFLMDFVQVAKKCAAYLINRVLQPRYLYMLLYALYFAEEVCRRGWRAW